MGEERIRRAEEIARRAHAGQTDKSGGDYIEHPRRVAGYAARAAPEGRMGEDAQVVGWLHDVVEDTGTTLAALRGIFPERICAAVDAMTKRAGEPPERYCARVQGDAVAAIVKRADLRDNTDPARLALLPSDVRERLREKYARTELLLERAAAAAEGGAAGGPSWRAPRVLGLTVDEQTRCVHYRSEADVVAIRFACCGEYYPCHACHEETAGHPARTWPAGSFGEKAILCGVCRAELPISQYLGAASCPRCGAGFNERCSLHRHLYFAG
jgi:uncharacterized CHY-type Zn-finger protein